MVSRRVGSRGAFAAPVTIDRPHTGQETEANAYLDRRGAATVSWFNSVFNTDIGQLQVASAPVGGSFTSPTPLATTTATNGMEALLAGDAAGDVTAVWSAHHDGDQSSSVFDTFASQRPPVSG
jgi:hypothetical protein